MTTLMNRMTICLISVRYSNGSSMSIPLMTGGMMNRRRYSFSLSLAAAFTAGRTATEHRRFHLFRSSIVLVTQEVVVVLHRWIRSFAAQVAAGITLVARFALFVQFIIIVDFCNQNVLDCGGCYSQYDL